VRPCVAWIANPSKKNISPVTDDPETSSGRNDGWKGSNDAVRMDGNRQPAALQKIP